MENRTLYTRCPSCNTAFKVTNQLLSLAEGKVRCGACLVVFQASDYMLEPTQGEQVVNSHPVSDPQPETDSIKEPNTYPEVNSKSEEENLDSLQNVSSLQNNAPSATMEEQDEQNDDLKHLSAENLSQPETTDQSISIAEDSPIETSESDFNANQDENITHDGLTGSSLKNDSLTNDNNSSVDPQQQEDFFSESVEEQNEIELSVDQALEDDEYQEDLVDKGIVDSDELSEQLPIDNAQDDQQDFQQYETQLNDDITDTTIEDTLEDTFEDAHNDESLDQLGGQLSQQMEDTDFDPDPLDEFEEIVKDNKTGLKIKLASLISIILLIIALSSIWSNRQAIAWGDSWGSSMKSLCGYLPCHLQPKRDVSKIKLLQRQLTPDDEFENLLDVKILLINQASFAQPYPTIKILFSNKNGKQVASKKIKVDDYLTATSINDLMPINSEVHIQFKTELTGPDALGFEFIFE